MEKQLSPWVAQFQRSIGFALQVFPNDTPGRAVEHVLNAAGMAEALGLDGFFLGDHPAWTLECWLHMAAAAVTTRRIRLGSMVTCVYYRHPLMLARLAADVDNMSRGRLLLGLGAGWDANEFANFGLRFPPVAERQAALEEALTIIRGVWNGRPFSFHGPNFQVENVCIEPAPLQNPVPIILAGGGEKVTLRQVAQYADACNLLSYGERNATRTVEDVQRKLAALRRHCADLGRPYESILRTHLTGWLVLAENERLLEKKLAKYFPQGIEQRYHGAWRGFALGCTVEQAVDYYTQMADAGLQYFIVQTLDASDLETIGLLAQEVAPRVQARIPIA